MYPKQIIEALQHVLYPGREKDIVSLGMVEDDIRIADTKVTFSIKFDNPNDPFKKSILRAAQQAILTYVDEKAQVEIKATSHAPTTSTAEEKKNIASHIIGIHSGKGGVGKSTIAANLAVTFAQIGYRVGLLDADIHGPSIPKMFGCENYQPFSVEENGKSYIEPITCFDIQILSLGFFIQPEQAVVWRGGMASNAVKQLIEEGHWKDLDYLFIDFPPGTSDIHLTVLQTLHLSGIVIVTTPQPVALTDALRGIDMFNNQKINIPVLGIIENMSWFTPAELPNNKYFIFGRDGGKQLAQQANINLLGQIPIVQSIREGADNGCPITAVPNNHTTDTFNSIANEIIKALPKK